MIKNIDEAKTFANKVRAELGLEPIEEMPTKWIKGDHCPLEQVIPGVHVGSRTIRPKSYGAQGAAAKKALEKIGCKWDQHGLRINEAIFETPAEVRVFTRSVDSQIDPYE
jgi:hypothetical protein